MTVRSRKQVKTYNKYQKEHGYKKSCVFCNIQPSDNQHLKETRSFKLIKNIFGYSHWDNQNVKEHLLVVPKRHTDTISNFTSSEALEYMDLLSSYESRGYNVWLRAPQSVIKSISHQHTHLIKPGNKTHRFLFYLKKPYLRLLK